VSSFVDLMHGLSPQSPELRLLLAAAVVIAAGSRLGGYGEVFARKLGLGHALVGLILMAFATAMPELVTSVSAASVQSAPNLCMGNCFGSIFFNISILALLDIVIGKESLFHRVALKMAVSGAVSIVVICVFMASMAVELAAPGATPAPLAVGAGSLAAAVAYMLGAWLIKRTDEAAALNVLVPKEAGGAEGAAEEGGDGDGPSLGLAVVKYLIAVALILWAGLNLSRGGDDLAAKYGLGKSFVGSIFLAVSTSLPEVAATVGMVWRGHRDMAFGNLFGSNAFNILVLVVSDMAYRKGTLVAGALGAERATGGPVLRDGTLHFVTISLALVMTAVAVCGIVVKPQRTWCRLSWPGAAILGIYIVGAYFLYALGA